MTAVEAGHPPPEPTTPEPTTPEPTTTGLPQPDSVPGESQQQIDVPLPIEVIGRKLQWLQSLTTSAVLSVLITVVLVAVARKGPATGQPHAGDVAPALVAVCVLAIAWSGVRRAGLLAATNAKGGRSALVGQIFTVPLGLVLIGAALFGPVGHLARWDIGRPGPSGSVAWALLLSVFLLCSQSPWAHAGHELRRRPTPKLDPEPKSKPPPATEGTIVCCSGGGIRSASFCLGALESLDEAGIVRKASAIVGVSGGGYIAAAYASLRASSRGHHPRRRLFKVHSPEVAQLRKQTNYLAPSGQVRYDAAVSWAFGVALNLLLLWCALKLLSTVIAWQALALEITRTGPHWSYHSDRLDVIGWALPALGFAAFVMSVICGEPRGRPNRFWSNRWYGLDLPIRQFWSGTQLSLLTIGVLAWLLLAGVPRLAVITHEDALANRPTVTAGWVLSHLGYASPEDCRASIAMQREQHMNAPGACGATTPVAQAAGDGEGEGSIQWLTLAGVIGALVALGRSTLKASRELADEVSWAPALLWRFRRYVAPTLALGLLAVTLLAAAVRFTCELMDRPDLLGDWQARNPFQNPLVWLAFLGVGLGVSANSSSLFRFYRERLAHAFLMERRPNGSVDIVKRPDWLQMSRLRRHVDPDPAPPSESSHGSAAQGDGAHEEDDDDAPELVLCTTANLQNGELLPTGRDGALFVFSGSRTGLSEPNMPGEEEDRMVATDIYERSGWQQPTVATAMAISGGAIAPLAGRESRTVAPFRLLMALANVRTGAWQKNPYWVDTRPAAEPEGASLPERLARTVLDLNDWMDRPTSYRVVNEATSVPSIYQPYLYLTDGGHYDNLGLVEALRRRPKQVIVLDASGDPEDGFATIGAAIATLRMDGIAEVSDFSPAKLTRGSAPFAEKGWVTATARLGQGGETTIYYVKSVLTEAASWDVQAYKALHKDFPLTPTSDQLFDEFDFEAYRQLGWTLTEQMKRESGLVPPS